MWLYLLSAKTRTLNSAVIENRVRTRSRWVSGTNACPLRRSIQSNLWCGELAWIRTGLKCGLHLHGVLRLLEVGLSVQRINHVAHSLALLCVRQRDTTDKHPKRLAFTEIPRKHSVNTVARNRMKASADDRAFGGAQWFAPFFALVCGKSSRNTTVMLLV